MEYCNNNRFTIILALSNAALKGNIYVLHCIESQTIYWACYKALYEVKQLLNNIYIFLTHFFSKNVFRLVSQMHFIPSDLTTLFLGYCQFSDNYKCGHFLWEILFQLKCQSVLSIALYLLLVSQRFRLGLHLFSLGTSRCLETGVY